MADVDRHLFVVFGGTGDLAARKLIPSLFRLITDEDLHDRAIVLGVATTATDDDGYRDWVKRSLADHGVSEGEAERWCADRIYYQHMGGEDGDYRSLRERVEKIEASHDLPGNRAFYLALPPAALPTVIAGLGAEGLGQSRGWTRVVIEKPFGVDLATARRLNGVVHRDFDESQIYRIDHYLGKETVQNLLTFRFANPMFESVWNRDRVSGVEISVAEDLGIGTRAGYYESAGAVRDMVQNHLTQLLTLIAMEPPISFNADRIRNEKVKVLDAIALVTPDDAVFGQYQAGTIDGASVLGYRDEPGVDPASDTPTYAAIRLSINTWRWHGVPFILRTGKRLPARLTQIAVTFHRIGLCLFHGEVDSCIDHPNVLSIILQPDEGFSVQFDVKAPGQELRLDAQQLHFLYSEAYGPIPPAYQTLILDIMQGDQTLFVRADEVEASWKIWSPLLSALPKPTPYPAGSWGPHLQPTTPDPGPIIGREDGEWDSPA